MSNAIDLAPKEVFQTLHFIYGDTPTHKTYTDRSSDFVADDGLNYVSTPNIEVDLPDNDGGLAEKEVKITMLVDAFTGVLGSTSRHAPVKLIVREYTMPAVGGPGATVKTTFVGRVSRTVKNHQGQSNLVLIQAIPFKSRLGFPLGFSCNHECENALGDALCKVDMNADGRTQTGVLDAVDGKIATISGLTLKPDRFWHRGYVQFDGLTIMIQEWRAADAQTFVLVRRPPSSWIGQPIQVFAGCDKSKGTCALRYNNEDNFNGPGFAIPAYSPNFENPG